MLRVADIKQGSLVTMTQDEFISAYFRDDYGESIISEGSGSSYGETNYYSGALVIFEDNSVKDAYRYASFLKKEFIKDKNESLNLLDGINKVVITYKCYLTEDQDIDESQLNYSFLDSIMEKFSKYREIRYNVEKKFRIKIEKIKDQKFDASICFSTRLNEQELPNMDLIFSIGDVVIRALVENIRFNST